MTSGNGTGKPPMIEAYDPIAEEAVIGSCLIDAQAIDRVTPDLLPADFFIDRNRWTFEAIYDLDNRGIPIDLVVLSNELRQRGQLDEIGGPGRLMELINTTPSAGMNAEYYAQIVREKSAERRKAQAIFQAGKAVNRGDLADAGQILIAAAEPSHDTAPPIGLADYPPLPDDVAIEPSVGIGAGAWLDEYTIFARNISPMTPDLFHISAGLALAAGAIARRLFVPMYFGNVYSNLFILWLAVTTLWRKSTALDVARGMARAVIPHLLFPQEITPEALLSDMAGHEPTNYHSMSSEDIAQWQRERDFAAQRILIADELSGMLASAGRDYNGGLLEAYLRFYDCDPYYVRSTVGKGRIVVHNSCLTLLGASTPAAMSAHLNSSRLWAMGYWPRHALLTPEADRPEWILPDDTDRIERDPIADRLAYLHQRLPRAAWPAAAEAVPVTFGAGAFDLWSRYNKAVSFDLLTPDLHEFLHGVYGRLPAQALKVSTILAALDWKDGNAPVIELPHMTRAIGIVESWRASAHRVLALTAATEATAIHRRVLRQVGRHEPKGATFRDLYRAMKDKTPSEIEEGVNDLIKAGEVIGISKNGKGPKTTYYHLAR